MKKNPQLGYPYPPIEGNEPIIFRICLKNNTITTELDFSQDLSGIKRLELIGYKADNLNNTDTLLFRFEGQPTVPTYSNDDFKSYFPLMFDNVNQVIFPNTPIPIMGKSQVFNCSHRVKVNVKKANGLTPVIFSNLELIFKGYHQYDQSELYYTDY